VKELNNIWIEVGDKKAREKASQCLRERTPDVLPYISQLRQHQDHITEQGVTMLQQQLQMNQSNMGYDVNNTAPAARRNSIVNMPDRPTHINMNRRGSMPVATATASSMPVKPTNLQMHLRRGSLPGSMQGRRLDVQQLIAHRQQVLREAYTVIELNESGHPQSVGSMQMMGQQQAMANRQAMMQQQEYYVNYDSAMMAQNQMMAQQQNQMMRNNMGVQQNQAMMRNSSMGTPPHAMVSPSRPQRGVNENCAHIMVANSQVPMHAGSPQMQMSKHHSPVPRSNSDELHPVRNIDVSIGGVLDDLEPLPYDDTPIPLSMAPEVPKSATPRFISPDVPPKARREKRRQEQSQDRLQERPQERQQEQQAMLLLKERQDLKEGIKVSEQHHGHSEDDSVTYEDLQPLPLDDQDKSKRLLEETFLREYRKTLEEYISNHQISTPAVDIDDDASEEGVGYDGIDAAAWIQQALHDSADMSLTMNRKNGGRRGVTRENSKKSLMSTDGSSYTSLAFSEMEQSGDVSTGISTGISTGTREQKMSAARSMASNHSVMSELTDFGDLIDFPDF
jgi:hypothetical protein